MKGAALATALIIAAGAAETHAAPRVSAPPPLPLLPSIPRVHVDVAKTHLVIVEEVNLPRGAWRSGDLDLFVSFGAPGMPRAFDAHVVPVQDGALEPSPDDAGEALTNDRASRRPATAHLLLGRPQMAGTVVHLREAAFKRALAPGNMAALRLRTVLSLPELDATGGREVLVRLGTESGPPLTLGRVQMTSIDPFVRTAEARLCGKDADPYPLAVALAPTAKAPFVRQPSANPAPIAPVLAVRHPTDDLCIRFVTLD